MNENGEDTIARLWSAEGEKPTLDEIKSMFAHLETLCVKKGRVSCKKWRPLLYTSERKLTQTNTFIHFNYFLFWIIKTTFPRRELSLRLTALWNQSTVQVHDFHSDIYGVPLYECETEEQRVKLSPNKCLIIFPLYFQQQLLALVEVNAHGAPRCVRWVVYEIFLKDGGYCVLCPAAKVMKRGQQ